MKYKFFINRIYTNNLNGFDKDVLNITTILDLLI